MMKLYVTNPYFDKAAYVACLLAMNIPAEIHEFGVMIDIIAYRANYKGWNAPHMVYVNHQWVKALYAE